MDDYISINICDYINSETIYNYLIDTTIVINENDSFLIKVKKFLLKYKKIISFVFLILLLIIGYYCDYSYLEIKNGVNNSFSDSSIDNASDMRILKGGGERWSKIKSGLSKTGKAIKSAPGKAARATGRGLKFAGKKTLTGWKPGALSKLQKSKVGQGLSKVGQTLKSGKMAALKSGAAGLKNFGENRITAFKESAPWLYSILYSIAMTIMLLIIILPTLGFFVIGLVCYVILKDKIGFIKSL